MCPTGWPKWSFSRPVNHRQWPRSTWHPTSDDRGPRNRCSSRDCSNATGRHGLGSHRRGPEKAHKPSRGQADCHRTRSRAMFPGISRTESRIGPRFPWDSLGTKERRSGPKGAGRRIMFLIPKHPPPVIPTATCAEFEDERLGRPDDHPGTMGPSFFGKSGSGQYHPRVEARPRGRGYAAPKKVVVPKQKVAPNDTRRAEESEGAERCQSRRTKPRASTEAQRAERSQLRRPKPIGRSKSLASKLLRRTERSQSRRTKPAALKEARCGGGRKGTGWS
jgi:hypothetical protein